MSLRIGQEPPLEGEHLARRETLPPRIILAQGDEFGRGRHLQDRPVELLRPVRPRVQETREIVMREGRLECVIAFKAMPGIGEDLHPVRRGDLALLLDPIGEE